MKRHIDAAAQAIKDALHFVPPVDTGPGPYLLATRQKMWNLAIDRAHALIDAEGRTVNGIDLSQVLARLHYVKDLQTATWEVEGATLHAAVNGLQNTAAQLARLALVHGDARQRSRPLTITKIAHILGCQPRMRSVSKRLHELGGEIEPGVNRQAHIVRYDAMPTGLRKRFADA